MMYTVGERVQTTMRSTLPGCRAMARLKFSYPKSKPIKNQAHLPLQRHEVDGGRAHADDHVVHVAGVRRYGQC